MIKPELTVIILPKRGLEFEAESRLIYKVVSHVDRLVET